MCYFKKTKNMKNKYLNKIKTLFKRPLFIAIFSIVLISAVYFVFFKKGDNNQNKFIKVEKGTIVSEVLVTGNVVSSQNVNLAFTSSGRIKKIYVKAGDRVKKGEILMSQDTSSLEVELERAKSALKNAEANYNSIKNGATPEEIRLKEAQVKNAEIALSNALTNMVSAVKDAYVAFEEAIYVYADDLFKNPETYPQLLFQTANVQLSIDLENKRQKVSFYIRKWKDIAFSVKEENIEKVFPEVQGYALYLQSFVNELALALNDYKNYLFAGQVDQRISSWENSLSSARAKTSSAMNLLNNAFSNWKNSLGALEVAKRDLELRKSPPTKESLDAAEANVLQAKSQVDLIQTQINQSYLKSPINGIVAEVYPKEGEVVSMNQLVVSVIGDESLEVEAYVSESDVAKIKIGNPVEIKFDAFPGETFKGSVYFINPASSNINGVNQYKIKVAFDKLDERIKSGMTTNLIIQTAKKENVLIVPQYTVLMEKDGAFVFKKVGEKEEKIPIVLGLQDQLGNAEVISGLNEGDEILNIGLK
jgi:HlyD family secretion protein